MGIWLTRCSARSETWIQYSALRKQALETVGHAPEQVTTDGHGSSPRAIRETLGDDVLHRWNHSLNNLLEQDHRGIKQRYYPMRGFGSFTAAARFCRTFDEVRHFFRFCATIGQSVSLAPQRDLFHQRLNAFTALILSAYFTQTGRGSNTPWLIHVFPVLTHPMIPSTFL